MQKVRIDGYGTDGHVKMTVRSRMDAPVIRGMMQDMIRGGLVPVIRDVGMPWEENKAAWPECSTEEELKDRVSDQVCCTQPERSKLPFRKYKPFSWAELYEAETTKMKLEMKVDQQTLSCEGFGMDVLKAQERFLRAIMPEFEGK